MRLIEACKFHGHGNDFLIVPAEQVPDSSQSAFARSICDPHFGIGADGCIFVSREDKGAFRAAIFNQDGSQTGMTGNGVRCVAAFLHYRELAKGQDLEIKTLSGRKIYTLLDRGELRWTYRSLMGEPSFAPSQIPFSADTDRIQDFPIDVRGEIIRITALWVGNPQCVVFVDELPEWRRFLELGEALEAHPLFPEKTNVSFAKVEGKNQVRILIYERGVGPTHSSGTGSCGAAVAAIAAGKVESPVEVKTQTGVQTVEWRPGHEIVLTGAAELIGEVKFAWRAGD
ncbi:MAG TPA: diaminopimelate epimerase [Acidobacteriota bacterium]|nr:diaminopimelate epimerase [Acidobacteriota bacterium]